MAVTHVQVKEIVQGVLKCNNTQASVSRQLFMNFKCTAESHLVFSLNVYLVTANFFHL